MGIQCWFILRNNFLRVRVFSNRECPSPGDSKMPPWRPHKWGRNTWQSFVFAICHSCVNWCNPWGNTLRSYHFHPHFIGDPRCSEVTMTKWQTRNPGGLTQGHEFFTTVSLSLSSLSPCSFFLLPSLPLSQVWSRGLHVVAFKGLYNTEILELTVYTWSQK